MNHKHCMNPTPKASLLLMEDDLCKRGISRNSSVGCSSRIYFYCRSPEGVPFKWEMQPGTPRDPPPEEIVPPITPPPAILSLRLPKPSISVDEPKPSVFPVKLKIWKHLRCKRYFSRWRDNGILSRDYNARGGDTNSCGESERYVDLDVCSSSSSCSSSCSLSGSNNYNRNSTNKDLTMTKASRHGFHGCSPWNLRNMRPVFVRVPRK